MVSAIMTLFHTDATPGLRRIHLQGEVTESFEPHTAKLGQTLTGWPWSPMVINFTSVCEFTVTLETSDT